MTSYERSENDNGGVNRFKIRYVQYVNDGRKKWNDEDNKVWAICKKWD